MVDKFIWANLIFTVVSVGTMFIGVGTGNGILEGIGFAGMGISLIISYILENRRRNG